MDVYFYLHNPHLEVDSCQLAREWYRVVSGGATTITKPHLDKAIATADKQIERMQTGTHSVHDLLVIERYRALVDELHSMHTVDTPCR